MSLNCLATSQEAQFGMGGRQTVRRYTSNHSTENRMDPVASENPLKVLDFGLPLKENASQYPKPYEAA